MAWQVRWDPIWIFPVGFSAIEDTLTLDFLQRRTLQDWDIISSLFRAPSISKKSQYETQLEYPIQFWGKFSAVVLTFVDRYLPN